MGASASVYLRAAREAHELQVRVWHLPKYFGGAAQELTILVNGRPTAFPLTTDQPQVLNVPLAEPLPAESIIEVELRAARTFDPALQIGGSDHTPKALMLDWVELD